MKISRDLNLVVPVELADERKLYVHSTPISRQVFETYFRVMSKTFAAIFNEGLGATAGPAVSYLMLKDIATQDGSWSGPAGVENGLVNEIVRLSNVAMPGDRGWETIDLYSAMQRGTITADDRNELLGAILFFTLLARVGSRQTTIALQEAANRLWGFQLTSSSFMDFIASLPTSTPAATSNGAANDSTPAADPVAQPAKPSSVPR